MGFLPRIEEILLISIWKLKDNAYGIAIIEQVEKLSVIELADLVKILELHLVW